MSEKTNQTCNTKKKSINKCKNNYSLQLSTLPCFFLEWKEAQSLWKRSSLPRHDVIGYHPIFYIYNWHPSLCVCLIDVAKATDLKLGQIWKTASGGFRTESILAARFVYMVSEPLSQSAHLFHGTMLLDITLYSIFTTGFLVCVCLIGVTRPTDSILGQFAYCPGRVSNWVPLGRPSLCTCSYNHSTTADSCTHICTRIHIHTHQKQMQNVRK